jgi:acetylornithine deacetylase/succinyl-diaminopimelate desuccinylase-like protein
MNLPLDLLTEFLRIPSVSAQPEHLPDMAAARSYLENLFKSSGFSTRIINSDVHPAVFAEFRSQKDVPTVLVYGHYDVQPAGAPSQWTTPAFEPDVRKDRIYARGATDNKGQLLIHIIAAAGLIAKYGAANLPVNFKFIIEGEEEVGSPGVEKLIASMPDLFKSDYVVLSDTEMLAPNHPSIDITLRGVMDLELSVQTGSHDLHSGQFGGLAPNPAFILTHILERLKNGRGRVLIPGFYDDIVPLSGKEASDFRHLEPKPGDIMKDGHFYYLGGGESGLSLNRRRWSEPTLDITGLDSGYTGPGTKTIIPNIASAKLSLRLVPHQKPEKIYRSFISFVQNLTPKHTVLSVYRSVADMPYKAPSDHPVYNLAKEILKDTFGHPAVFTGQGGSIGFIPVLADTYHVPCVLIGFGLPDENVHAPNEHFSLDNFYRGITAITDFYNQLHTVKVIKSTDAGSDSETFP